MYYIMCKCHYIYTGVGRWISWGGHNLTFLVYKSLPRKCNLSRLYCMISNMPQEHHKQNSKMWSKMIKAIGSGKAGKALALPDFFLLNKFLLANTK